MEINLGNKVYEFIFDIKVKPNEKKLKKELSSFFEENELLGINIKDFELKFHENKRFKFYNGEIIPNLKGRKIVELSRDYYEKIESIGKKYGLLNLDFSLGSYAK